MHQIDERGVQILIGVLRRPAPGRVRLSVAGLRRRKDRETRIQEALARLAGIRLASASALTGNVLVLFDPLRITEETLLVEGARAVEAALNVRVLLVGEHDSDRPMRSPNGRAVAPIGRSARPTSPSAVARSAKPTSAPSRRRGADEGSPPWHALVALEVTSRLDVDLVQGLPTSEVEARRRVYGPNQLPEPSPPSSLRLFLGQLANAPSALLVAGAVLSAATGGIVDAALIGAVLLVNATIGAATERSGQRAIAALRRSVAIRARVRRNGVERLVEAGELVPGDLVKLRPGDPVPADARVVFAHRLQVEESALTGESHPVAKQHEPAELVSALADRRSMVYRGTTVTGGHGEVVVVATGHATVIGSVRALAAGAARPPAPLEHDLNRLGRGLALTAAGICGGVFGLAILRQLGLRPALTTGISLAVAAIPEGLAAIATTVLALGSGRMQKKGTLIRTLSAAEALGSVTVVCADKTGTITENRMVASECIVDGRTVTIGGSALSIRGEFCVDGRPVAPEEVPGLLDALRIGALCTDAEIDTSGDTIVSPDTIVSGDAVVIEGSATEGALLVAAAKAGLDSALLARQYPRVDRRDRGNGRRYMVTVHRLPAALAAGDGGLIGLAKGSPEGILTLCDRVARNGETVPLDEEMRATILAQNAEMGSRGLRVLGLAARPLPMAYDDGDLAEGFVWHGKIGLSDPIRPAAPAAIKQLHRAGIRTVMITGDQAPTATAIARELSLSRRGSLETLEAAELASLPPEVLRERVRDVGIFARVPPELKLAIVRALQSNGDVVAMTGDGVNDAAALRAADVGVAMGESGTELARELADVVLSTDDFSRFVDAVEEGRLVRCNVRRVLHYLLATNASEVWTVTGAVALGLATPLTPLQLLWLNVISDLGPAVGLATEAPPPDLMSRPPRDPSEPIVTAPLRRRILFESGAISLGALGTYGLGILRHGLGPVAQTMAFASLTGAQLLHVPLARSGDRPATAEGIPGNRVLTLGVGAAVLLQIGAVFFPPLRAALGGAKLGLVDVLIAALGSALPIAGIHGARALQAPRPRRVRRLGARASQRRSALPAPGQPVVPDRA